MLVTLAGLALAGVGASAQEAPPKPPPPAPVPVPALVPAPAPVAPAPAPATAKDPLAVELSLEVRSANVGELAEQLSSSVGVGLDVDPELAGQRVTLYADKTRVRDLQVGLGELFATEWERRAQGSTVRYFLPHNERLGTEARRLMTQRRQQFLTNLLQTARSIRQRNSEIVAREIRAGVARRLPYLSELSLDEISPDFIQQTLLLQPLTQGMGPVLIRSGSAWTPFLRLPATYQNLFAGFYMEQFQGGNPAARVADSRGTPLVLNYPQARLEYRLLHGDRWTGTMLLSRVGASDNWATAYLPSSLYDLPDYSALYPQVEERPTDDEVRTPIDVLIDTEKMNWDQALTHFARTAKINVLSDAYPRPMVFRPAGRGPIIGGTDIGHTLDRICDYYGYFWWKQGDFYHFRNRYWGEEERVAVPERVRQQMGRSLARASRLQTQDLMALAALSDEQLMSMRLYGAAAGQTYAPPEAFDYNEIQLVRAGLNLLGQMNDAQREQARAEGLPFLLMSPVQQMVFASAAFDRGMTLNPEEADLWRVRFLDRFERQKLPAGWSEVGDLKIDFQFGEDSVRRAVLPIRVPAAAAPSGSNPMPAPRVEPKPVVPPKAEIEIPRKAPGSK